MICSITLLPPPSIIDLLAFWNMAIPSVMRRARCPDEATQRRTAGAYGPNTSRREQQPHHERSLLSW